MKEWVTIDDLADITGKSRPTIYRRVYYIRDNIPALYAKMVKQQVCRDHKLLLKAELIVPWIENWRLKKAEHDGKAIEREETAKNNLQKRKERSGKNRSKGIARSKIKREKSKSQPENPKVEIIYGKDYSMLNDSERLDMAARYIDNESFRVKLEDPDFLRYGADRYVSSLYRELTDEGTKKRFRQSAEVWELYELCENTMAECCKICGISYSTYTNWVKYIPQIRAANMVYRAKVKMYLSELEIEDAVISLKRLASGEEFEEVSEKFEYVSSPRGMIERLVDKKIQKKKRAPNMQAIAFLLSNRDPERWKNRSTSEIGPTSSGPQDELSNMSVDERYELLQQLLNERQEDQQALEDGDTSN